MKGYVYFLFHINCLFLAVSLWLLAYKINKNGAKSQALSTVCGLNSLFLNQFFSRNAFTVCFQRYDISARYETAYVQRNVSVCSAYFFIVSLQAHYVIYLNALGIFVFRTRTVCYHSGIVRWVRRKYQRCRLYQCQTVRFR